MQSHFHAGTRPDTGASKSQVDFAASCPVLMVVEVMAATAAMAAGKAATAVATHVRTQF